MIGGNVLKVINKGDHLTLVVRGTGVEKNDVLHVDVEAGADVEETDSVWWQGGKVMVTRGNRFEKVFSDKPVKKIGYSYGHYHVASTLGTFAP